jgi:hypothetical protein
MESVGKQFVPVSEPLVAPGRLVSRVGGAALSVAKAIHRAFGYARGALNDSYPEMLHATDRELAQFAARYGRHNSPGLVLRHSFIGFR